ncbi:MAG: hypothetical protein IMZ46_13090 [Acidobacteria bacterium]|nr:hypothetical protein [Acidobacteriota bacterium]
MKKPLRWVPLFVDPWIFGSSRHELTRAQRSDFIDLLLLSAKDQGYLRANETMGYPIAQLAGLLCVQPAELEETIELCVKYGKLQRFDNGILYISSWEQYKLTPQYRGRIDPPSDSPSEENEKIKRGEENKGNGNKVSKKGTSTPPPHENDHQEFGEDGLLTIPKGLPFKARDELIEVRARIRHAIRRPDHYGKRELELEKASFNQRIKDLS